MEEPVICKICKEPIWNYFCVDCLKENCVRIIPQHVMTDFLVFHKDIVASFSHPDHTEPCISCRKDNQASVCPYCYLNEVWFWMIGKDPIAAKRLLRFLPTFKNHSPQEMVRMDASTITHFAEERYFTGVCDRCGLPSGRLRENDIGFICGECEEEIY